MQPISRFGGFFQKVFYRFHSIDNFCNTDILFEKKINYRKSDVKINERISAFKCNLSVNLKESKKLVMNYDHARRLEICKTLN